MDISKLIDQALGLARALAPVIPILGTGAAIVEKVEGIFTDLHEEATVAQQNDMIVERATLRAAVTAKARAEAAALRGEG